METLVCQVEEGTTQEAVEVLSMSRFDYKCSQDINPKIRGHSETDVVR